MGTYELVASSGEWRETSRQQLGSVAQKTDSLVVIASFWCVRCFAHGVGDVSRILLTCPRCFAPENTCRHTALIDLHVELQMWTRAQAQCEFGVGEKRAKDDQLLQRDRMLA